MSEPLYNDEKSSESGEKETVSTDDERTPTTEESDLAQPLYDTPTVGPNPRKSLLKRLRLLLFVIIITWLAVTAHRFFTRPKKPQIIYASRYSKEYKFRPAASPIITETLRDGRLRIRGGSPTPTSVSRPAVVKNKKRSGKTRRGKKGKQGRKGGNARAASKS